jgi:hypothetical protein
MVQGQPRQIVHETPISKITRAKWTGGVAQVIAPTLQAQSLEFKTQSYKKRRVREH